MSNHRPISGLDKHQREFIKLLQENSRRYRKHEVFRDFCELTAITLSNAVDVDQYAKREARYLEIVKRYERHEVVKFAEMFSHIVESLSLGFHDCLGQLFMALELGDHWKGQFFTPYSVCQLMAQLTFSGQEKEIARHGFMTMNEPTVGAGAMVIALAETMMNGGVNYQQKLHVIAQDLDETAVHMTYIQLALFHVPAVVVHGNSLMVENRSTWLTPAHIIGGWARKLRQRDIVVSVDAEFVHETNVEVAAQKVVEPVRSAHTDILKSPVKQLDLFV